MYVGNVCWHIDYDIINMLLENNKKSTNSRAKTT